MKTHFEDFSIASLTSRNNHLALAEIIDDRQAKFSNTAEYIQLDTKIKDQLKQLAELSPEAKKIANKLIDDITWMECISFIAAYKDGMSDLMTAITFNKLNITNAEYLLSKETV